MGRRKALEKKISSFKACFEFGVKIYSGSCGSSQSFKSVYSSGRLFVLSGHKKKDLEAANLKKIIKDSYRRQAKIHHPDLGGFAVAFRKINKAYRELLQWADNPRFSKRKGFTDKWFYDGENDKWVQPIPLKK